MTPLAHVRRALVWQAVGVATLGIGLAIRQADVWMAAFYWSATAWWVAHALWLRFVLAKVERREP